MAQLANGLTITRTMLGGILSAAGSSAVDGIVGATVDMANYDGVMFLQSITCGGTSNTISIHVRGSSTALATLVAGGTTGFGNPLTGSSGILTTASSSATSEAGIVDLYRPRIPAGAGKFLALSVSVASSCAVLGQQFAFQYAARSQNVVAATTLVGGPPNSTAANSTLGLITVVRAVSPSS